MTFLELNDEELSKLEGGIVASAVCTIVSGVCYVGAGIAAWTGHNKAAAGLTIAGGACDVAAGVTMLLP